MYHSLSKLPKKVLPDANVLLDAAFVVDGLARRSMELLEQLGFNINISESILVESKRALEAAAKKNGLRFDPITIFENYLQAIGALYVPSTVDDLGLGVNRADRHVVSAARHYGGWILTGDAPLIVESQRIGVAARFPWDVVMEWKNKLGIQNELGSIIRVVPPTREKGLIFARVIPGAWRASRVPAKFAICDIEGAGCVYYEAASKCWGFALATGAKIEVKCAIGLDPAPWVVCGFYTLPGSGRTGRISIRAATTPESVVGASTNTLQRLRGNLSGRMSFGHSLDGKDHWNGHLRAVVIGPHSMKQETWKALISSTCEGAPNPYDSDGLSRMLKILNVMHSRSMMSVSPIREEHLFRAAVPGVGDVE